jgi:hypothetical protein
VGESSPRLPTNGEGVMAVLTVDFNDDVGSGVRPSMEKNEVWR